MNREEKIELLRGIYAGTRSVSELRTASDFITVLYVPHQDLHKFQGEQLFKPFAEIEKLTSKAKTLLYLPDNGRD